MNNISKIHYWQVVRCCVNMVWMYRLYINGEIYGHYPDQETAIAEYEKLEKQIKQNTNQ